jgi:hypothetical protein
VSNISLLDNPEARRFGSVMAGLILCTLAKLGLEALA